MAKKRARPTFTDVNHRHSVPWLADPSLVTSFICRPSRATR